MAREVPPAGVGQFRGFHNGRKMQDSLPLWQGAEDRGGQGSASRRGRPVPGLPQRQENAGFAAVVARAEDRGAQRSASRRGRPVPGLPQRQENAGFAAVVARGGGPGCLGKHLSQGSASSGASATAGKCRIRCRCGKGRRTGVAREVPPAGVGQFRGFHNGRKMQDSLPLWQGAEDRAGRAGRGRPQVPTR